MRLNTETYNRLGIRFGIAPFLTELNGRKIIRHLTLPI